MDSSPPDFLAHQTGDQVAVAVRDVEPGRATGAFLDTQDPVEVEVTAHVPLGHKIALDDIAEGSDVIEYGLRVAIASADIKRGDYVHVHNVRSARWQNSVA